MEKQFKKFTLGKKQSYSLEHFPQGTTGTILAENDTHLFISLNGYDKGRSCDLSFVPINSCVVWYKDFVYGEALNLIKKVTLEITDEDEIVIATLLPKNEPKVLNPYDNLPPREIMDKLPGEPLPSVVKEMEERDRKEALKENQKRIDEFISPLFGKLNEETLESEAKRLKKEIFEHREKEPGRMIDTMVIELDRDDVKRMFIMILKLLTILEEKL